MKYEVLLDVVALRETAKLSSAANARRASKRRSGGSRTVNSASVRALCGEAMKEKTNKTQGKTMKKMKMEKNNENRSVSERLRRRRPPPQRGRAQAP